MTVVVKEIISVVGLVCAIVISPARTAFPNEGPTLVGSTLESSFELRSTGAITVERNMDFGDIEVPLRGFDGICAIRLTINGEREILSSRTTAPNCTDSVLNGSSHQAGLLSFTGNLTNLNVENASVGKRGAVAIEATSIQINNHDNTVNIGGDIVFPDRYTINNDDDASVEVVIEIEVEFDGSQ